MDNFMFPQIPKYEAVDWRYVMRRQMQEIVPNLYLGPYAAAMKSQLPSLQQHGITHIVCIRQSIEANFVRPNFPEYFRYLVLDIADCITENIIRFFAQVRDFLNDCFQRGGKALVHGNGGISRSAALVIAFIMETYGLSFRRFCINPNEGFAQQLMEYEPIYRAKLNFQFGDKSRDNSYLKRKHPDDDDSSDDEVKEMK
ncbi:serine/threonine/tyrosine-interacting protein-like isoform X2 [Mizuhopecten yessoensis]|uniref:serine/threonine/tyrosine-interacting protein-like isoform X2 n=1 Tax=Mizuhopecten yessoensis TaxID=6573 RepID=UPI000B45C013|nr:serine/threonine/tyrosine-interacting protein-like isoform X2 [Mizuhopecten yessoensis]